MQKPCHLYQLPIGGTATASVARLLHEAGNRVTGVDSTLYPPMSAMLAELGVPVRLGYDAALVPDDVHEVTIGNALPRNNEEAGHGDICPDLDAILAALRAGVAAVREGGPVEATALDDGEDLLPQVSRRVRPGDALVCVSSGDLGDLPRRLLLALEERP